MPFVPFPSLLSSSSASPSRSTTVQICTRSRWLPSSAPASHWMESGHLTDSAPNTTLCWNLLKMLSTSAQYPSISRSLGSCLHGSTSIQLYQIQVVGLSVMWWDRQQGNWSVTGYVSRICGVGIGLETPADISCLHLGSLTNDVSFD